MTLHKVLPRKDGWEGTRISAREFYPLYKAAKYANYYEMGFEKRGQ